jgi:sarcosine oxidase, subunit alpha
LPEVSSGEGTENENIRRLPQAFAMPRLVSLPDPVTIHFDGRAVPAARGEPVAVALVAAGHLTLARSPKFHRPRGPYCFRAACDGCLARVDEVPNVMTCRTPATEGMRIEAQNVVGSAQTDLLRATDWLFPEGMNHHELFVGVPGLRGIVGGLARRIAGLGRLPKTALPLRPSARRIADVLVVGSGAAGMSVALELAKKGRQVEVIDDSLDWGGAARVLDALGAPGWGRLLLEFAEAVAASRVVMRLRTTAAGIYGDDVVIANGGGRTPNAAAVEVVTARTLVLATGAHDGVLAFEGNDLPGVMSVRAGCILASHGVTPGRRVVVAISEGGGQYAAAYAKAVPSAVVIPGTPLRVRGGSRLKEVTVAAPDGERRAPCDALLVDAARAPAYELCWQAGADLRPEPGGFVVHANGGKIRDGVYAVGEVVGTPLDPAAMARSAESLVFFAR